MSRVKKVKFKSKNEKRKITNCYFRCSFPGYAELVEALQRLQGQLNKQGFASLAGRVTAAQSCLLGPAVARALHIRAAVLQRRRPRTQNPVRVNAQTLARDVSDNKK